jgi:hypothetical protein
VPYFRSSPTGGFGSKGVLAGVWFWRRFPFEAPAAILQQLEQDFKSAALELSDLGQMWRPAWRL